MKRLQVLIEKLKLQKGTCKYGSCFFDACSAVRYHPGYCYTQFAEDVKFVPALF